jgi:hypothetical protein
VADLLSEELRPRVFRVLLEIVADPRRHQATSPFPFDSGVEQAQKRIRLAEHFDAAHDAAKFGVQFFRG